MIKTIKNGKVRNYYKKGDILIYKPSDTIFEVESVDTKEMKIYSTTGGFYNISHDIEPTYETLKNAKIEYSGGNIRKRSPLTIKIKYQSDDLERIKPISIGDWIDLRSVEDITLKKGEFKLIPLGVAMELPKGFEANTVPRSSTYKNFKILQTNCFSVIDNSYCGDNDWWFLPVIAMEDTVIHKNERVCQFRINKKMPTVEFIEVEHLGNDDRGGHGSTGVK